MVLIILLFFRIYLTLVRTAIWITANNFSNQISSEQTTPSKIYEFVLSKRGDTYQLYTSINGGFSASIKTSLLSGNQLRFGNPTANYKGYLTINSIRKIIKTTTS